MKHFLSLAAVLAVTVSVIVSCGNDKGVSLTRVDPLEKLLPETTWSYPYSEVEEVAAGEHATFQFALRSAVTLEGLSLSFEALTDDAGNKIESVTTGFVDYIHVGRTTPDPGRDAIKSLSGMYPDRIVDDAKDWEVPGGKTQPIWVSVAVPKDAAPGVYTGKVFVKGRGVKLSGEIAVKVYPIVLEEPTLWVTNWFNAAESSL